MLNLNKTKIRGISLILVLVMALALCLTGCKDADARKMAESASKDAASKLTEAQVSEAINKALTDYAKKSDVTTLEAVKSEITSALADYVKKTDAAGHLTAADVNTAVTEALKTYATTASVQELINQAKTELGAQVTAAQQNLQATVDKATADASGKMDLSVWKGILDYVIEKCQEVDHAETAALVNEDIYTPDDWQKVLDIYYGAKIKLYRAYDKEDVDGVMKWVNDEIAKIPTAVSVAKEVQELILAIGFPATTESADAAAAARAKYDTWKTTYPAFATEAGAEAKGISVGLLEYAEEKVEVKTEEAKTLNAKIKALIVENAANLGIQNADTLDDAALLAAALAGKDGMPYSEYEKILTLKTEYDDFIGKAGLPISPTELERLKKQKADEVTKYDEDTDGYEYDNEGVAQRADGSYVVALAPVLDELADAAYASRFNELKTQAINDVLAKMAEINAKDPTYKAQVTKLGSQFADVMEAELWWRDACYHKECNEDYDAADGSGRGYPGATLEDKFAYATEHLRLVNEALLANDAVDGFYYYLEQVAVQKGNATYVDATFDAEFVKGVIIDCYRKVNAVSAATDKYELYKLNAINRIAAATNAVIGDGEGVEGIFTTQRAKDAAKNLVLKYIASIKAMTMRDSVYGYKYDNKGDLADKQAQEHFDKIVEAFTTLVNEITDNEHGAASYEATNITDDAVKKVINDACDAAIQSVKDGKDAYDKDLV